MMIIRPSEQSIIKLVVMAAAFFLIISSFGVQHISASSGHHNASNLSLCAAACETPARRQQEANPESKQRAYRLSTFNKTSAQHEEYSIELLAEFGKSDQPRIVDKVPIYKQIAVYLN